MTATDTTTKTPFVGLIRFPRDLMETRKNPNLGEYHPHYDPVMSWKQVEDLIQKNGGTIDQYFYLPGGSWDVIVTGLCDDLGVVSQIDMALGEFPCIIQPAVTGQRFRELLDKFKGHTIGVPTGSQNREVAGTTR